MSISPLDCLSGPIAQQGVNLRVIVVDNASCPEGVLPIRAVFLYNKSNAGYSTGDNMGARMAVAIGCEAVLIVNPDYVRILVALIMADPKMAVACSAIRNLSGAQENPMTEPGFVEKLLWPVVMIAAGLFRRRKLAPALPETACRVEKVTGAYFMIRTDLPRRIGFFDESVFLYCEESILRTQVRAVGWHMMMGPKVEALCAHQDSAKGDPLPRFRAWMESRSRFHNVHGGYGMLRQALLTGSRAMTLGLIRGPAFLRRVRNGVTGKRIGRQK